MEHTLRATTARPVAEVLLRGRPTGRRGRAARRWSRRERPGPPGPAAHRELQRLLRRPGVGGERDGRGWSIDVLTGDWLAELTMFILHKTRRAPAATPARSCASWRTSCRPASSGASPWSPMPGADPEACAEAVRELARARGSMSARLGVGRRPSTALGELQPGASASSTSTPVRSLPHRARGHGQRLPRSPPIADALAAGAQVVVTGRVTDASVVVGPAMQPSAGATTTSTPWPAPSWPGHVIECGAQCCGGNYAFFDEVPGPERIGFPWPSSRRRLGGHHQAPRDRRAVSVGTVTAQLLYEIGGPRYQSPDAVARFDTFA